MTQFTNSVALPNTHWINLGAGPLSVAALGPEWPLVALIVSDAEPALPPLQGEPLRDRRFFGTTSEVWAIASGDATSVIVTAPDAGFVAEGTGYPPSGISPVTGAFTATGQSASFAQLAGRGFNASGWGTFSAGVQLERSFDKGTTWLPITTAGTQLYKWTAPWSESAEDDEVGVLYRLNCTSYMSGTVNYRISQ